MALNKSKGEIGGRRPLKSRSSDWAHWCALALTKSNITPNQISMLSIFFATFGAAFLVCSYVQNFLHLPYWLSFLLCAVCVQLRLLCNLLDGMVAIEGEKQSALGGLFNEVPDRIADSILIVALGYATPYAWLGWLGALAAVLTAYIRALGGTQGLEQDFRGPLAKPHRMFVMTMGCIFAAILSLHVNANAIYVLTITASIIAIGSIFTCATRLFAMSKLLNSP